VTRKDAINIAQADSRNGYVQHVNRRDTIDDYFVSDWFDADTTADSFENGIRIGGVDRFTDLPTVPVVTIEKAWDGNECETEGRNGRTYVSAGRWQWVVVVDGVAFNAYDTKREAKAVADLQRQGVK